MSDFWKGLIWTAVPIVVLSVIGGGVGVRELLGVALVLCEIAIVMAIVLFLFSTHRQSLYSEIAEGILVGAVAGIGIGVVIFFVIFGGES